MEVTCDFRVSPRCKERWRIPCRVAEDTRRRNGGRIICLQCSRATKASGRGNPNCRYSFDDRFFATIDTDEKAYLLGWIASDGSISRSAISLYIHRRDLPTLQRLRDVFCSALPIGRRRDLVGFSVSSRAAIADICRWLDIVPGKKSSTVGFPGLASDDLTWAFMRGYFDGDGSITSPRPRKGALPYPRCALHSSSARMLDATQSFVPIPGRRSVDRIEWDGNNALDLMARLYDGASLYLGRKRDAYLDWATWVPGLSGAGNHGAAPRFRWVKTLPDGQRPVKRHASDSGYDVTLVRKGDRRGLIQFYRTGIKVQPDYGWYFDLLPRSSISKTGHILANSVGVIDRTYVGEILVPLIKIDPSAPELVLPARIVQLVPRPIVHFQVVDATSLNDTQRNSGGFGSTSS